MRRTILAAFLYILFIPQSFTQEIPTGYFRSPLDIPLLLSGSFGELRTNHFHTGIDIKTNGVEGLRVYATADGYISRVNVSHYGYGCALYMTHPNGFTTVYAHLSRFSPAIEKYVHEQQYVEQSETVTLDSLPETLFRFKKGDVIGWTGNTGHSGGPHLHFEIRETSTELALNPWLFGFDIKDDAVPVLYHLRAYPLKEKSFAATIEGSVKARTYSIGGSGKNCFLKSDTIIDASGTIGFAIHTTDLTTGSGNKCGIYSIELFKDDTLVFSQVMKCIDFKTSRYINSHMDYRAYKDDKNSFHKSFIDGNNQLAIYPTQVNQGKVMVRGKKDIRMKYVVKDVNGNTSVLKFIIRPDQRIGNGAGGEKCEEQNKLQWNKENVYTNGDLKIVIPEKGIYDDLCLQYQLLSKKDGMIAPCHIIHDPEIPVQDYFSISFRTDTIPDSLHTKITAVLIGKNGWISNEGGEYKDGFITFKTRAFGTYSAMLDTVAPVITPINISDGKVLGTQNEITVSVADNLSGVKKYNAYIDGKWVLLRYNVKTGKLTLKLKEEGVSTGEHLLEIKVADERGNIRTFAARFTR